MVDTGGERCESCSQRRQKHEQSDGAFGPEPGRQDTARYLGDQVAPEERAQNDALGGAIPNELTVLKEKKLWRKQFLHLSKYWKNTSSLASCAIFTRSAETSNLAR